MPPCLDPFGPTKPGSECAHLFTVYTSVHYDRLDIVGLIELLMAMIAMREKG